jgi:ClpP class serine protease
VRIDGPIEQRAGYHDICAGWSDGHDAICERLCAAFEQGDALLVVDSPGGAAAGLQQAVARVLEAKQRHGRRCTAFADEMIGSAADWWVDAICDECFLPPAGQKGSIGARGEHLDISGMMAKEGLKKTYFADPPDKIAFAPEFPLGPVGEARGNRDVKIAADAFRAAVCAGPIGQRYQLTPEYLVELGADMLTGQAAVEAGLADGVESFDAVVEYALTLANESARSINDSATEEAARAARTRAKARTPRRAA